MRLSRPVVLVVLVLLFLIAFATRQASLGKLDTPYFKGTSAIDYRHMLDVADGQSLRQHDAKANAPEGYVPVRERACGAEAATGLFYRGARFFSEIDGRQHARRTVVFVSALCVFTAYLVASGVWASQAAGLLAAFLIAFLSPLIYASNGRSFTHGSFAMLLGGLHAFFALRSLRRPSLRNTVAAALLSLGLLATWEPAPLLIVAWLVVGSFRRSLAPRARAMFVGAHAAALAAGFALLPYLTASLAPSLVYFATRLRFVLGRPESPGALSDWMRSVWSVDHAPSRLSGR